jgi:hypothetical protein
MSQMPEEPRRYTFGGVMRGVSDMVLAADYDRLRAHAQRLQDRVEGLEAFKRSVDEALNSGDGSYRP